MSTLNRHQMRAVLTYLDAALAATRRGDPLAYEGHASWNIRMARETLLEAAIADVEVEAALKTDDCELATAP